jgi:hypothetical protein
MLLPSPSHGSSCPCSVEIIWGRPLLEPASMRPQVAYGAQFQTWHDRACSERGQRATVLPDRSFAASMASFRPSQEDALADVRTRNRADRRPRKRLQSLSGRRYFAFRTRFRLVACVYLTRKYRRPLPMGALPIRSSDVPLFSGVIGSRSSAGLVLPPPETPASLSPSLRGGASFFATHLRTSHRNLLSGGPKPDECQSPRIATASHSSAARELDRTAVEVPEFVAHLFEREPEGKQALRGVDRHTERQTLVAKRGDHPGASVDGGFGCLERRGFASGASASALPRRRSAAPSAVRKRSGPGRFILRYN